MCATVLLLSACGQNDSDNPSQGTTGEEDILMYELGTLVTKDDAGRWLVTQIRQRDGNSSIDATWFSLADDMTLTTNAGTSLLPVDLRAGQQVKVWYRGGVDESYPSQAMASKIVVEVIENNAGENLIPQEEALQAAFSAVEQGIWAVKEANLDQEHQQWKVELVDFKDLSEATTVLIDAVSGNVMQQPVAENEAFKIFSPAPESEVSNEFTVTGEARVFEAVFQWRLEDGHNVLAEGVEMTSEGAPAWGQFQFDVSYERATSPTVLLILYVSSAKDGSVEHELILPFSSLVAERLYND